MRFLLRVMLSLVLVALVMGACQTAPAWVDVKDGVWWHDAVFYEIFVRSFYDSNGDGIGDFNGITAKLDYLNDGKAETKGDLGVTGIWLMPINPSPSYHGYDVTDYYDVNPQYGTLDDLKNLIAEAHKRGIHVIMDFVINHTSTKHPWFQAANDGDAQYRDWYIWAEKNPGYKGPWGEDVWHQGKDGYYYGVFVAGMPDLNYGNEAVNAEIQKVASFWLKDVGMDGLRVDGAKHLIEEGQTQENTDATRAWFIDFLKYEKGLAPDKLVVGEVWSGTADIAPYVNGGALDMAFNFPLADDMVNSALSRDARRVSNGLAASERAFDEGKYYATFLTNHDMPRVMTALKGDVLKAKNAASMLLTAPGVPFLYYGEEIGMVATKPDEKIRRPMQWTAGENAGFTTANVPWMLVDEKANEVNVEVLEKDANSLLNHYRALIAIRNEHYALRQGQFVQVSSDNAALFATLRTAEQESVLVLVNLSDQAISNARIGWMNSPMRGKQVMTVLMGKGAPAALTLDEKGGTKDYQPLAEIGPGETVIVQLRAAK